MEGLCQINYLYMDFTFLQCLGGLNIDSCNFDNMVKHESHKADHFEHLIRESEISF